MLGRKDMVYQTINVSSFHFSVDGIILKRQVDGESLEGLPDITKPLLLDDE